MSKNPHIREDSDRAHRSSSGFDRLSASSQLRNVLFTITVITAFALGIYSLFLAYVNAGKVQPLTTEGLLRTATAVDGEKIKIALGDLTEQDLVYVVLDVPEVSPDPGVEVAAEKAAQALADSGLVVSVRLLDPRDPDFMMVVAQNGISRFPVVLAVKEGGGIVLVTDDLSEKNLLHAYYDVWGKTSSCDEARSAVY